ncbi:DNA-processing protein DprA [candidate division KSB1 bacterium]
MKFSLKDLLTLHFIPKLGPFRVRQLVDSFKTADALFNAGVDQIARLDKFDTALANQVKKSLNDNKLSEKVENQLRTLEKHSGRIITLWDEEYPENLKNIYNPPVLLFVKGNILKSDKNSVAVVGSRNVSDYGKLSAERISEDLASKGLTINSGMASGIDAFAHKGAINAGGRTLAVLGCGIDIVYPAENVSLYKEVVKNGAIISEFPLGTKPWPGNFPARNRIISGLSLGTVVVEAAKRSGALITASAALEQNREVFAIPGNISSSRSEGTNALIRDSAAKLVQNAGDIIAELNLNDTGRKPEEPESPPVKLTKDENKVYSLVGNEPILVDKMSQKTGVLPQILLTHLLTLELKGLVRKLPGNKYIRV